MQRMFCSLFCFYYYYYGILMISKYFWQLYSLSEVNAFVFY